VERRAGLTRAGIIGGMLAELALAMFVLLVMAWLLAPRGVAWASSLSRQNAGAGARAEWMAPPEVVETIKSDYMASQAWLTEYSRDWGLMARGLHWHASGDYRRRQTAVLASLVGAHGPRLAATLEASHRLSVRRFSADGLSCLLIDSQTARTMVTRGYWSGRRQVRQRLPDTAVVWAMGYDLEARRWKVNRFVQTLPPRAAMSAPLGVPVTVSAELPRVAGRDN
jgi:hypothetical protein